MYVGGSTGAGECDGVAGCVDVQVAMKLQSHSDAEVQALGRSLCDDRIDGMDAVAAGLLMVSTPSAWHATTPAHWQYL